MPFPARIHRGNLLRVGIVSACALATACGASSNGASGDGFPAAAPADAPAETGGDAPRVVQPGAPGQPSRVREAPPASASDGSDHTADDVRFMQDMIVHHAQALVMSRLAEGRAGLDDLLRMARRIGRSQTAEIARMQRWLEVRDQPVPDPATDHAAWLDRPPEPGMHGMASLEELDALAAAEGSEFDRLFLTLMIRHHRGALRMIEELFARPGAGREGDVFQMASDIGSDQRIEIARMVELLADLDA